MRLSSILLVMAFAVGCSTASAKLTLVEEGQPRAVIVVSADVIESEAIGTIGLDNPDPAERVDKIAWAARDFQHYIEKMSGVKLQVVPDDESLVPPGMTRILVGRSKLTEAYDQKIPSGLTNLREEDGYAILTGRDTLVLAGNDEKPYHGTEYAVSFFLHRLGVRWYMPSEFGEVIPKQSTIVVSGIEEVSRPDFKMRNWWTHWFANDLRAVETRWKIHNGMNRATLHAVPGDSSARAVLPPEDEKDNPEFADVFARKQQSLLRA